MSFWGDIAPRQAESLCLRSGLMMAIEGRIAAEDGPL
ncbi:Uncharacterised protein [Mycobacteroides abscessus subsp. abscessus]|nr:Uncharacterised protein [Mycobacteroides abscessus subsp. abscessus]SKT87311.1 Uncharacterised protein [Mycobacteroides abscessus subsp. massiliense]SHS52331.1 Uncharacterised protein [Mycobacteroides abscessus subsp. abscessus]SHS84752.1 Uncharacterised protein [Mycobacteroides abscessus subsp. abscessus]SHS87825.1 Uncharacterised protein [Mycobacteroides abscessus subsp. abscessus]